MLRDAIIAGLLFGFTHGMAANAAVPTFTRGTMTSRTESFTRVTETYNIVDYSTGSHYTMSGSNITVTGTPGPTAGYAQTLPGHATQFSESNLGPGVSRITNFTRLTEITSTTDSISVFTQ